MLLATACTSTQAASFRAPTADAHRGGVLTVAISTPGSVDPGNDYEPAGDLVIRTLCDTLLTTDPATGAVRPGLAESWVVADGGAKLVLRLRKGLRFSDGSPLTASDVKFSLSRVASADFASVHADALALVAGYDTVHGDKATDSDTARRRLAGIATSDKRTVEISLSRPFGDFLRVLTTPLTAPVSQRAAEADPTGFSRRPICAGPYRLAEPYLPGADSLRLVRSTAYVPSSAVLTGGGTSYADEIRFVVKDGATAVDVRPAQAGETRDVVAGPGPEIEYVGLPTDTPPFDRADVRQALALALSRDELTRRVFPATRVPAAGFAPPTTGPVRRCDALPAAGDSAQARALLQRSGVDLGGIRVPIVFNDELRNRALVTEVARQWHDVLGLTVIPTPLRYPAFLAQSRAARGFGAPFRWSWSAYDIDGYVTPLLASDSIGRDNASRFSDHALDEALAKRAWRAVDAADRAFAYGRVLDEACAQMPMVPLTESLHRYVVSSRVSSASGTVVDPSSGQPLLRELWVR